MATKAGAKRVSKLERSIVLFYRAPGPRCDRLFEGLKKRFREDLRVHSSPDAFAVPVVQRGLVTITGYDAIVSYFLADEEQ